MKKSNAFLLTSLSNHRHLIYWLNNARAFFIFTIISFCGVILSNQSAYAQQTVSGQIKDKTHTAISGAVVKLESALLSSSLETTTKEDGSFLFLQLSPGGYQITVSSLNYKNKSLQITVTPRANVFVDLDLDLSANATEVIEVKDQVPFDETKNSSLAIANPDTIKALPLARRTNLPDLIAAIIPGAVASHDNFIHFRGNELSVNTAVNGVTFIDNPHQYFAAGIPPDVIQSFTVLTGGFPAEYGNRFGGIVDAVTRSGFDADNHGSITLSIGNFLRNNISAEFGGHTKKFGYYFYAAGTESLRFINPPQPQQLHSSGKGLRTFAGFDYKLTSTDTLKLVLINSGSNFQIPNTTQDELDGRNLFQRSREQTAILTYEKNISAKSLLVTSFYERLTSNRLLQNNDPVSVQSSGLRNNITLGLRSDYTYFANSRHTIKTGLELTLYRLREDFQFDPRTNDDLPEAFNFRGRKTGGNLAFYFQDKIRFTQRFTANLGFRYDQYSLLTSEKSLSPRINLSYTVKPQSTTIFFSYNRLFAPSPIENLLLSTQLAQTGPPRPVKSNVFELGISQIIKNRVIVQVTSFFRNDDRSYELTELANTRYFLPSTFNHGRAFGLETSVQLPEIPHLGLSAYFNYTAQRAFQFGEVIGGFTDEMSSSMAQSAKEQRMSAIFDQIHTGTAGLMWREKHSGFNANLTFEYGSGTPFPDNPRLPSHFIVNLYTGIDIFKRDTKKATLQFNIENLTNRVYAISKESEFTPLQFSSPRYFSSSLRFQF